MSNQEIKKTELVPIKSQTELVPAKDQTDTPIDKEYAKQLSQAHRARAMARTREMYIG